MKEKWMGFARLARPANLPTAAADILAGMAIGLFAEQRMAFQFMVQHWAMVVSLIFSSIFLYAGGVVFNDVFDAELDAVERPERAIPSGLISLREAVIWGVLLMSFGIGLAFYTHVLSGIISVVLTMAIIGYDAYSKKFGFLGPLNMGVCRGLNLLLGISILGTLAFEWTCLVPVVYIFAITLISRGEVHGNNKNHILLSGLLYAIVIASIALICWNYTGNLFIVAPFLVVFGILIYRPLIRAYHENSPKNIKKAVMAGVLSLVVMNACWVAGFSGPYLAALVVVLLPLSILLSKLFAVT